MNNKYFQNFLFFFLLIGLCVYFDYMHIATLPPLGQHAWRQTDGASQALNYYQFGLNFFKPEVHNIVLDGGASVGEFPILYYISALFMHIFGAEAWVIRVVHLVVFALGLWFLFRILRGVSGNWVFATGGSLMFFTLPVMVFYAFNFLPNAPALGLVFISWWYFYQFYTHQKASQFAVSMIFMALAGLLKPTMLISFCVILGIWILEILRGGKKKRLFTEPYKVTWTFLIVFLPILTWRLWADSHSNPELFLNRPLPIWEASKGQNDWTWTWLYEFWFKKITFTPATFLFFSLIIAIMLIFVKKFPVWLWVSWFLMLFGVMSVGALFFQQFSVHDYYAIEFLVLPALAMVILAVILKECDQKTKGIKWIGWSISSIVFILLILNTRHAKADLVDRYAFNDPYLNGENKAMYKTKELRNFIKNMGITPQDTVLSICDPSPNTSLFYLNLKGFTLWNDKVKICEDAQSRLPDPACVEFLIKKKGCKYLIISNLEDGHVKPLKAFMTSDKLMGIFDGSVYVYRLK